MDVYTSNDDADTFAMVNSVMGFFFGAVMVVAMGICFFSLVATMFSNIHVSRKEIGMLRALGMTKWQICRSYVEEAFVLVLSSSTLGVMIGSLMAATMALQQSLFLQLDSQFVVPTSLCAVVLGTAVISAVTATLAPLKRMLRLQITEILKLT